MIRTGVIGRAQEMMEKAGSEVLLVSGIQKNPSFDQLMELLPQVKAFAPERICAIGGGSALDAAKGLLLFYEFPFLNPENVAEENAKGHIPTERKTELICVPSTSGTGSELTRGTVLTDLKNKIKVPIMTDCLRPDLAILDGELPMTMPEHVAAETGMDALTHAMEAYINKNMDDFDEGLAVAAIRGIMKWLPQSCLEVTEEAREKVHNYQAMAGIAFANVGLGMVHGMAHSFGAAFNLAHGLTNAIILPYALRYNSQDPEVAEKLKELSYVCRTSDIILEIEKMREEIGIPATYKEAGITEEDYKEMRPLLLEHAMLGATKVNPVPVSEEDMSKMLDLVYYGGTVEDYFD